MMIFFSVGSELEYAIFIYIIYMDVIHTHTHTLKEEKKNYQFCCCCWCCSSIAVVVFEVVRRYKTSKIHLHWEKKHFFFLKKKYLNNIISGYPIIIKNHPDHFVQIHSCSFFFKNKHSDVLSSFIRVIFFSSLY